MSRQPSWLLWATLPAVLFVIAFGLWLHLERIGPTSIDQSWLELVGLTEGSVPYWIAVVLAEVGGGTGVVICTTKLTGFFILRRRLRSAIVLVTTMLAAIWILAMMWSRTALQVHWLTDTIAGAFIGIAVAVLVDEFWTLTAQRTRSPRFALWLAG
ncbi:phosphatase PAP2 family protein [Brevibacterium linens]|uniref:phosphatase PAP2 family protein n=1 Tax=Brevibacterium linens TaxID=1703 RepID=UPI003F89E441